MISLWHRLFHYNEWKHMHCKSCTFGRVLWGIADFDSRMRFGKGLDD